MKLDRKDIEAIAKSRTNRAEGNKLVYYSGMALLSVMVGAYFDTLPTPIRFIIASVGIIVFYWYLGRLSKRTNMAKNLLIREWEKGNK